MKAKNILAILALLPYLYTNAQIIYTDIDPDVTVNTWNAHTITLNPDPLRSVIIWYHPWSPNQVVIQTMMDSCEILWDASARYPAKLDAGAAIGNTGTWATGDYDTLNIGGVGNWATDATDKYIGFRYRTSGQWRYGWIRMDVDQAPTQFTVKDWAYQSQAGQSIQAGATGTTGLEDPGNEEQIILFDQHTIRFPNLSPAEKYSLLVYNIKGQLLISTSVNNGSSVNLNAYGTGLYIVALSGHGTDKKWKLLVP